MEASTSLMTRRSLTLYDQLSVVPHNSKNLRDLLKQPDSSDPCPGSNPNSTPSPNTAWRTLRDLLQLHTNRTSEPNPNPETNPNPNLSRETEETESQPERVSLMALLELSGRNVNNEEIIQSSEEQQPEVAEGGDPTLRVSLMALLEQQSERTLSYAVEEERKEEEQEDGGGGGGEAAEGGEGLATVCCVCMIRHKGAAFIPCGHTFCRRCSRDLHVTRGTCPLCNGPIVQVLDIF